MLLYLRLWMKVFGLIVIGLPGLWSCSMAAPALDFTLPDLENREVRLADFRGQWVIINFWATWCPPCVQEMPELQTFYQAQRNHNVTVLGINMEAASTNQLRSFVTRLGIGFPVLLSGGKDVPGLAIKGLPTTWIIAPSGQIVDQHVGMVNATMLSERLATLQNNRHSR